MIIRAVIVPHPPLLVPELVGSSRIRTEPVRAACVTAARRLADVAQDWVAVAADPNGPVTLPPGARGTFAGYGVDVPVSLDPTRDGTAPPDLTMPLPALVAGWLRKQAGARRVRVRLVEPGLPVEDCLREGTEIAEDLAGPAPVGLLVLGDGSNRHTDRAPARPDDRAGPFDEQVRDALAAGDPAALLGLDAGLAGELNAVGRAAWQLMAGAAQTVGEPWQARLLYSDQPFGVAYHVAVWDPPASALG
ncbi:MAG TPA: class III extradiol dioxygenase subunit B-like domain-containing protein [Pseudonocardiaceae bacterium]